MPDYLAMFPPGLTDEEKQEYLDTYPDDPFRALAEAWADYAATLPIGEGSDSMSGVHSVSTGAQSVTFGKHGGGLLGDALGKVDYFRRRAKIQTPQYGPEYKVCWPAEPATGGISTGMLPDCDPCWEGTPP